MTYLAPVLIAYIIGVVSCCNNLPFIFVFGLLFLITIFLKLFLKNNFSIIFVPIILSLFLLGNFLTHIAVIKTGNTNLFFMENKEVDFVGKITNITEKSNNKIIITAESENIIYKNISYKPKLNVNLYTDNNVKNNALSVDDLIKVEKIKMIKPYLPSYPGQFNYQKYLLQKGVAYIIYINDKKITVINRSRDLSFRKAIFNMRKSIMSFFDRTLYSDSSKLISSIVLGEKNILSENLNEAFIKTGTLHIIAASGFNVSILITFCFFMGNVFSSKKALVCILSILLITVYTALCDFSPSIVRAAILGIFIMIGIVFDREKDSTHLFLLSAFLILLFRPLWLFDIGFQLSFVSCLGIIFITPIVMKKLSIVPKYLNSLISISVGAQLFLFPILIYYFGKISSIFLISNIMLIPIVEFLMPLSLVHIILCSTLNIFTPVTSFFCWVLSLSFLKIIYFLSKAPFSLLYLARPGYLTFILFYGFVFVLLFGYYQSKKGLLLKIILCCLCISIFLAAALKLNNSNNLTVTFLNAKGGECVFIQAPSNKTILIDAGGRYLFKNYFYDCADKTILPYMRQLGIRRLDMVIISHPHNDHMGGLFGLLQKDMPIKAVAGSFDREKNIISQKALKLMNIKNIKYMPLKSGDIIEVTKDIKFFVLYPNDLAYRKRKIKAGSDINNNSIVLKLVYKNTSFLFTGDIQKETEKKLIYAFDLKSNVLKVAHQGSKTSSSCQFIEKVNPQYAVISADKYDRFGHPDKKVLNILKNDGIKYFVTSINGPVTFKTNGKNISVHTEKPL